MPDVVILGLFFLGTAQTMIEESILPRDAQLPCRVTPPALEQIRHHRLPWKTQQGMEMIWHEKPERNMPLIRIVVKPRGIQQSISNG